VSELYKRNPNVKCAVCKKEIYRRPGGINPKRVFCSATCYGLSNRKESPCLVCKKMILSGLNKKTCSRSCANTYRHGIKYKVGRPRDKVSLQNATKNMVMKKRGEKCERCGYGKPEILQIHHKDRDRKNNNLSNLELICPNCHCMEHYGGKSFKIAFLGQNR
jgi:hypothetical protein